MLSTISLGLLGLLLILCIIRAKLVHRHRQRGRGHLPPGPRSLPILGFLHHFAYGKNYSRTLASMKDRYGPMCTVQMGAFTCLWLNDATLIREAWANPAFCGRPKVHGITCRTRGQSGGLIFNEGVGHVEQRRFTLRTLKNLGLNRLEELIREEAAELVASLHAANGVPISTRHRFNVASINALWRIVTGEKLGKHRMEVQELVEALDRNMELSPGVKLGFFIPWLARLCPRLIGWNGYVEDSNKVFDFSRVYAQRRVEQYDEGHVLENGNNFIDNYIQAMKSDSRDASWSPETLPSLALELELGLILQDLFIAGTETTATTLCWALLYLAKHPTIQEKVTTEISEVIGTVGGVGVGSPLLTLADRPRMIYTQAFIQEVLRHATLAPLGMLHSTMETVTFHGYVIPAGTIVQANICGAHRDPEYWGTSPDVEVFEPERFIDNSTADAGGHGSRRLNLKNSGFLAFSHGKRLCPGESLARDELFLFLTSILQEFQIELDPKRSGEEFDLDPIIGVSAIPKPHRLIFKPRTHGPDN